MPTSLSKYELQLVTDPNVLLTKSRILQIVGNLLSELAEEYKKHLENTIAADKSLVNAKISRGENYEGLPYLVMDYPRQFGRKDVFAIRSFFWWGNFFSITLQLDGEYQQKYSPVLKNAIKKNSLPGWFISISDNQWKHDFDKGNYVPVEEVVPENIEEFPFIKLAKKIPLTKWDDAYSFFIENFILITNTLAGYAPIL